MSPAFRSPIGRNADLLYDPRKGRSDDGEAGFPMAQPGLFLGLRPRLGFGCAGLMQSASGRQRQRILAAAFEQGIRHFDVARMYGLGAAERELGKFARGRREELVIATKFGVEPAGPTVRAARVQAPARAVVARVPALRKALKRRAAVFHQPHSYDPVTARASLETSLRELGTDHVDILFVHDPAPGEVTEMAALGEALKELRRIGLVRAWGLSGESEPCIELSRSVEQPTLLQIRDGILDQQLSRVAPEQPTITFGILSGALKRILSHVRSSDERRKRWNRMVGEDCARAEVISSLLLQDALSRNSTGGVLFSTTCPERVKIATAAAEGLAREPDPAPLRAFRELVLSELTPHVPARG